VLPPAIGVSDAAPAAEAEEPAKKPRRTRARKDAEATA